MSHSSAKKLAQVRPDSKGRIALGKLAKGVSSFVVLEQPDGALLLEPMAEVPAREKWLFENRSAVESVRRGLEQSGSGELRDRGSFARFSNEDENENED